MPYGIELTYTTGPKSVKVFDKDGNRRLARFDTIEQAEECARALSYQITASHYRGWTIVDLSIPE